MSNDQNENSSSDTTAMGINSAQPVGSGNTASFTGVGGSVQPTGTGGSNETGSGKNPGGK